MDAGLQRGLILQHGEDGPPGLLGEWLAERGVRFEVHDTWREELPADAGRYAWIASLGSEHTPGAESAPAWVEAEVEFLGRALEADVPVLGLCFGGQALALAAGGSVFPSEPPEVGWLEVQTSEPALIPPGPWLHFHYDLLRPPASSRVIAWSPAGPAAFVLGASLGLQFHPESTGEIAMDWARFDARRLAALGIDPSVLVPSPDGAREAAFELFDGWSRLAGVHGGNGMGTLSKAPESASGSTAQEEER
jgi:GMP synthase-like glutamine amidotransferase